MNDSGVPSLDELEMLNRSIIEKYKKANPGAFEAICLNKNSMQGVLDRVGACHGLCAKASVLMCGIAWAQPFSGANKRTAIASAKVLLGRYGMDVDCSLDGGGGDALRRLLLEIQERRACLDPGVLLKTQICLWRHLREHAHEPFNAMARRIIEENAVLFDHMAREAPLPARLSAEEEEMEQMIKERGPSVDASLPAEEGKRILLAKNPCAGSLSAERIRMLVGSGDAAAASAVPAE